MCGIVCIFGPDVAELRKQALQQARLLRHRGPDWSGVFACDQAILAHERLSIVDIDHGAQPLVDNTEQVILAVNGEIYNHKSLRAALEPAYPFRTDSDCEVILPLYQREGMGFFNKLNGIYAFALYDKSQDAYLVARDPIGIIPLYWGRDEHGNRYVASEMKALIGVCNQIEDFPPGHFYWSKEDRLERFYQPPWWETEKAPEVPLDLTALREGLEDAVRRQLMCDVPYGVLLSGGLDSSVIAAIASRFAKNRVEDDGQGPAWWPQLHSFSIGLDGSPDLAAARKVAAQIGTIHHEFHFTVQEGLDAIADVIYHIETFDVTTIRASTPMYLMARKIRSMGIKMLLSGEGADEIFGGYLYFHKAPNAQAFFEETVRKIKSLYKYDCLRANKSSAAWGIETRVPFLDLAFLEVVMNLDPSAKMVTQGRMEKQILREAFEGYLPDEVLWRQKEQFSDGVGYSWIDSLKAHAEHEVADKMMENARFRFPLNTPLTKEAYWYRSLFEAYFPTPDAIRCVPEGPSIACSTPAAIAWDKAFAQMADPSGRAVRGVHQKSL
ncbi:MAG: asparagine synthase B [Myxococcales bacterium]|nr:asparagine synthase B [Myxococcales bacterium]